MRKTIRNGIDRRAVYKFRCTGSCGRVKASYVYERAKAGICLTCSKHSVDPNQATLFTDMAQGDSVDVTQQVLINKNGAVLDVRTIAPNGEILSDFQEENQGYPLPSDFQKLKMVVNQPVPTLNEFVDAMKHNVKEILTRDKTKTGIRQIVSEK